MSLDVNFWISNSVLCTKSGVALLNLVLLVFLEMNAAVLLSNLVKLVLDMHLAAKLMGFYLADSIVTLNWVHCCSCHVHSYLLLEGFCNKQTQENLDLRHFLHIVL